MQNYTEVPNIITGKDLNYLSDMFNWNYSSYKKTINSKQQITDAEIFALLEEASGIFYNNLTKILNILQGGENGQ